MKPVLLILLLVNLILTGPLAMAEGTRSFTDHQTIELLAGEAAGPAQDASAVNLLFQPAGFLQFGPIVELEFRLSPGLYMGVHLRFHGLGLLTHLIDINYPEIWGIAGGAGMRYFLMAGGAPEGFFVGGVVEVGYNGYYDNVGDPSEFHGSSVFLVTAANGGFRWRFGNFIVEVGAYAGVAPTLYSRYSYDSAPSVMIDGNKLITFFGMAELSIGWAL